MPVYESDFNATPRQDVYSTQSQGGQEGDSIQCHWCNHYINNVVISNQIPNGNEMVTNPDFSGNANGWTLGSGWAYNTNQVTYTSDGLQHTLSQDVGPIQASLTAQYTLYNIHITVTVNAGSIDLYQGDEFLIPITGDEGIGLIPDNSSGIFSLKPSTDFSGSVFQFSIKGVPARWCDQNCYNQEN